MGAFDYLNRRKNLHDLLKNRYSGTAQELAKKLGVERRTLFNYFEVLRTMGAEISYDISSRTYRYKNEFVPIW
jgi:predicted DNA-binding transcriptional regulator YafY